MMETPETVRSERDRRSIARAIFACVCNVLSLLLTYFPLSYAHGQAINWDRYDIVRQCIWLAPTPVVVIFRRFPVATVIYALSLFAVLALRVYDVAVFYTFGPSA